MADRRVWVAGAVALVGWVLWATPASAQWQIESKDGKANLKIGLLAQPQLETLETVDQQATSANLFIRRLRLLFGGAVSERWSFFVETDSPNIGKGNTSTGATSGVKEAGNLYVQDAFVTYTQTDAFKIEAGMFLMPHSRNGGQSAATLLAVDYGPYTFLASGPSAERMGHDYGVQLRGYPAKQRMDTGSPSPRVSAAPRPGIRCGSADGRSTTRSAGRPASSTPARSRGRRSRPASAAASTRRKTSGSTPPTGSSSCRPSARPRDSRSRSTGCGTTAGR